jgi:RNA-directed DNA polymerase
MNTVTKALEIEPLVSVGRLAEILGFSPSMLHAVADKADSFYRPFPLTTPTGKVRPIDNPIGQLKAIQSRIKDCLLTAIDFPPEIVGGVRGRSIRTGALQHVRQPQVVTLDIRKFFRTIRPIQVAAGWQRHFATGRDVTWLLTRLTTYQGYLPQGAPTSTALANVVFLPMALELRGLCTSRGLRFTVYVDDIAISGTRAMEMLNDSIRVLSRHGFGASRDKTQIMFRSGRQQVTGLVVNRKVSNGRTKLRLLRTRVASLDGPGAVDLARVRGAVAQASSACPSQGRALRSLFEGQLAP